MRRILSILCSVLLFSFAVIAQSQATTGNIEGRVTDQNGAGVPNATVTATNQDTGFTKTTQTDGEGNFVVILLPPGKYRVDVPSVQGFSAAKYENINVTVGAKTGLPITLTAGGSVNVVDVNGEGQTVELTRTSISSTVDE